MVLAWKLDCTISLKVHVQKDSVETGEEHSMQERTSTKFNLPLPSTVKRMTDETIASLLRPFTVLAKWIKRSMRGIVKLEYLLAICLPLRALALRPRHFEHEYLRIEGISFVQQISAKLHQLEIVCNHVSAYLWN